MATTPEGKVKDAVKKMLEGLGCTPASKVIPVPDESDGWYYMPSQNGYGVSGIPDFVGHYKGKFFAIETKKPGLRGRKRRGMSAFQAAHVATIGIGGAIAVCIDCAEEIEDLRKVLLL